MIWQFNPFAIPLLISAIPLIGCIHIARKNHTDLTVRLFLWFTFMAMGLVLSYAAELLSATLGLIKFWLGFEYFFQWCLVFWVMFALAYAGYPEWLTRRRVAALFIVPAIILTLVWTNDLHGLIWSYTGVQIVDGLVMFDRSYGPVFWLWMVYLNILTVAGSAVLLYRIIRFSDLYKGQVGLLIIGICLPWLGSLLTVSHLTPVPLLDLTPFGVALTCIPFAISLFYFRFLDIIPIAYHRVFRGMVDSVIVCDEQLRVVELNPTAEKLVGQAAPDILGRALEQILPDADFVRQHTWGNTVTEDEISWDCGENPCYYHLVTSPLCNSRGRLKGWIIVLRDITARKQAEKKAYELTLEQEKVRLLRTFIENVSHDFATPITILQTGSNVVRRLNQQTQELVRVAIASEAALPPGVEGLLSRVDSKMNTLEKSTEYLSHLVENMLKVTRLENQPEFEFRPVDLNAMVMEQVKPYRESCMRKRLTFQLELDQHLPSVQLDSWEFKQVLASILDNAYRYTPESGTICLRTVRDDGHVNIEIRDTGIGISPDDLSRIFDRFFRADRARSMATGGAGLGLSIAKQIVEAHGGTIEAASVLHEGSTFTIHLPFSQQNGKG